MRYIVWFTVNWKKQQEAFSTVETEKRLIEADFNTELDDRFFWENRELIDYCRIHTPEREKIPWLEEYYKAEEKEFPDAEPLPF